MFPMTISGAQGEEQAVQLLEVPAKYLWTPAIAEYAQNVAQAYALLAGDIRNGTRDCPTFDEAVVRHRLLDAIEKSSASGECRHI